MTVIRAHPLAISYGNWFWWVGGITLASLAVAVLLYVIGQRTTSRPSAARHRQTAGPRTMES